MKDFNFVSDNLDIRGFISKESILGVVTQEDIFKLVFEEVPEDYEFIVSPFRVDKNPGCWFEHHIDGKLRFNDFGNSTIVNGISMKNIDCFDAVQVYYQLPNFYMTLEFIYNTLIKGRNLPKREIYTAPTVVEKKPVKIITESRPLELRDKSFWFDRYGITKSNLLEDKVIPFSRYHLLNTKKGNISSFCYDLGYSFNNFPDGRKKLYFPHRAKDSRFLTTCIKDDIGGIDSLVPYGRKLIITKSYKDWRVIKNQGRNTVWFQNEGMIPDVSILTMLVKRFEEVIVFYDNDKTGIQASKIVSALINSIYPGKAKAFWLPEILLEQEITDPSDLYYRKDKQELFLFLNKFL